MTHNLFHLESAFTTQRVCFKCEENRVFLKLHWQNKRLLERSRENREQLHGAVVHGEAACSVGLLGERLLMLRSCSNRLWDNSIARKVKHGCGPYQHERLSLQDQQDKFGALVVSKTEDFGLGVLGLVQPPVGLCKQIV